jgi:hypothetical protein
MNGGVGECDEWGEWGEWGVNEVNGGVGECDEWCEWIRILIGRNCGRFEYFLLRWQ